jgi:hypothetical protein
MKRRRGRESDPHGCDSAEPSGALGAWVGMKQGLQGTTAEPSGQLRSGLDQRRRLRAAALARACRPWHARGQGSNPLSSTHTNPLSECPCPEPMNAAVRSGVMCQQVIPIGLPRWPVRPPRWPISPSIHRLGTPSSSHVALVCPRSCGLHGVSYAISSQQGRQLGHLASARSSSTIVARPPKTMAAPTR